MNIYETNDSPSTTSPRPNPSAAPTFGPGSSSGASTPRSGSATPGGSHGVVRVRAQNAEGDSGHAPGAPQGQGGAPEGSGGLGRGRPDLGEEGGSGSEAPGDLVDSEAQGGNLSLPFTYYDRNFVVSFYDYCFHFAKKNKRENVNKKSNLAVFRN